MEALLTDLDLSRRLERCEGTASAAIVEARARLQPDSGAAWMESNGALAMFDGVGSPLTQTFALGLSGPPDLDAIEAFFAARGADVFHEVSPLAGIETVNLLTDRGYRVVELTSVLVMPLTRVFSAAPNVRVADDLDRYAELAAEGWNEPFVRDLARVAAHAENAVSFIADVNGKPAGTGALVIRDGVALLAGASTIPAARRRGVQGALLETRLAYAAARGCELAMMGAAPGSASQRNAERQGFRIAYTRIKWGRTAAAPH